MTFPTPPTYGAVGAAEETADEVVPAHRNRLPAPHRR